MEQGYRKPSRSLERTALNEDDEAHSLKREVELEARRAVNPAIADLHDERAKKPRAHALAPMRIGRFHAS